MKVVVNRIYSRLKPYTPSYGDYVYTPGDKEWCADFIVVDGYDEAERTVSADHRDALAPLIMESAKRFHTEKEERRGLEGYVNKLLNGES